jgi:hypothetical protein
MTSAIHQPPALMVRRLTSHPAPTCTGFRRRPPCVFRLCSVRAGKTAKMTISVQWSAARPGERYRTQSLIAGSHGRQLHDLRGHLRDPAANHRPRRHWPRRPVALTRQTLPSCDHGEHGHDPASTTAARTGGLFRDHPARPGGGRNGVSGGVSRRRGPDHIAGTRSRA